MVAVVAEKAPKISHFSQIPGPKDVFDRLYLFWIRADALGTHHEAQLLHFGFQQLTLYRLQF